MPTRSAPEPPAKSIAADPAEGLATELDGVAPELDDGALAELTGDDAAARAAFERVLAAADAPAPVAARAALYLARMEARGGKARQALDLAARAAALAPGDVAIAEGITQLRADVVAASGAGDVRGPGIGTRLPGVEAKLADKFAAAERALAALHHFQPRPFEVLLGVKDDATEVVVARYKPLADAGGLVQIAAQYRIGSLYHDLAFGLLFELPPQLDPTVAAGLRRSLRGRALGYLGRAAAAYRASLDGPQLPEAVVWRVAAEDDLRKVSDVLREAGEGGASP